MPALSGGNPSRLQDEHFARTSQPDGTRSYSQVPDQGSAPLCDEQGRLIVRTAGPVGFSSPSPDPSLVIGQTVERGSAPNKNNDGLVIDQKVMERGTFYDGAAVNSYPYVTRMFGYVDTSGWVQLHLRDESGGANPPTAGDVPEVTIPVGAGQNFAFGDYALTAFAGGASADLAVYIALSTTGPTYTPAGAAGLWFYFLGYL